MQTSDPRHEWYELDVSAPTEKGNGARPKISRARTLLSVALCAMASYMAGGVIAADSVPAPAGVTIPDQPEDAAFVMSWLDDEDDGYRDYTVDTDADDVDDVPETDADIDSDRIAQLAEQYIADHTP